MSTTLIRIGLATVLILVAGITAYFIASQLLSVEGRLISAGVSIGLLAGIPLGMIVWRFFLEPQKNGARQIQIKSGEQIMAVVMSAEEAGHLLRLLERSLQQQEGTSSPASQPEALFSHSAGEQHRRISTVGGASLSDDTP